jgi:hypothetical protein
MRMRKIPNKTLLDALMDSTAESIIVKPAGEARQDTGMNYPDPDALVANLRARAQLRIEAARRKVLERARAQLVAVQGQPTESRFSLTTKELKSRIRELLARIPGEADGLTLAFRNGEAMSDSDMVTLLEDLEELERLDQRKE